MANINDYLKWRGDILIDDRFKFNEIDSIILARFSYLRFDKVKLEERETIESISSKMKNLKEDEYRYNGDKELIENLGKSARFKNMIVTDFCQNNDKDNAKQFSAITIHISDSEMYLSYIGTDSSIYGWKEDFNMSFMKNIPAQLEGKKYLENISKKYNNKVIRLGGHSKGGNVAVYSAITASEDIQNRIEKVYNYDGPGFDESIAKDYKNQTILKKIHTYIPQDSIIGRVLEHEEELEVVESVEKGIYQHDIYSWQVLRDDVIKLEKVTNNSEFINRTIKEWLKQTTPEQRKIFVDGIFELFYATSSDTVKGMSSMLLKNISSVVKTYSTISEKDRKTINNMLVEFGKAYIKARKHNDDIKS